MDAAEIKQLLKAAGAFKSGIAPAEEVDADRMADYDRWLSEGRHASMSYLEKYNDIRRNPALLLPGAKSVISSVFNYWWGRSDSPLKWASYALGDDYHDVVRSRLQSVADTIVRETGAECRVCVDTAPISERYWAVRSGVGFIGLNRQLIVPGAGTHFFLGEIVTTLPLTPDSPETRTCGECRRCLTSCPGGALSDTGLDANRCLSYLTIEHRGDFPPEVSGNPTDPHTPTAPFTPTDHHTPAYITTTRPAIRLGRHIYGCDVCQDVCPHNRFAPISEIEEFRPRPAILQLDTEAILSMKQEDFSTIFRRSAIKRTKLAGLQRNAIKIKANDKNTHN